MPYLTKWGQAYGITPSYQGNIFFVAPSDSYTLTGPQGQRSYSASDEHDGLSPERALRTPARFIALAVANAGDVCVLLEGAHTVTATLALSKAGLTFVGAGAVRQVGGYPKPPTVLTIRGTNDELLNVTASNITFRRLRLQGTADYSLVSFQTTSAGIDNLLFDECWFDLAVNATATVNTRGIDWGNRAGGQGTTRNGTVQVALGHGATVYVNACTFWTNGAIGEALHVATGALVMTRSRLHNDAGTWATPVLVATNADNSLIDECVWTTSGTMTVAAAGPRFGYAAIIADSVTFTNNRVTANLGTEATAFLGFGTGADLAENYVCSSSASVAGGGTLITRA